MKTRLVPIAVAIAVAGFAGCSNVETAKSVARPNVLLLVADDLGYSDIGAFGSEIATPNLDELAKSGRVLTNFHTSPNCSPTRAMLMTGNDSHRVGLGSMAETTTALVREGIAPFGENNRYGWDSLPAGYEGYLNDSTPSLPQRFRSAGYHTYMAGKWHLAGIVARAAKVLRPGSLPDAKGFERSFALMEGGASHFAPVPGKPTTADLQSTYFEDSKPVSLPADFYSSRHYTDKVIEYIESNRRDGKPFLAYAAYTAPHFPLQAPDEDIARQRGKYDAGYDAVRAARLQRQKDLGLLPAGFRTVAPGQGPKTPVWAELSAEQRAVEARKMEVYAAMVENMDRHVGRLVGYLKATGAWDNTVVVFMSDNGSHGGPRSNFADNANTDNSLANMGRPRSNITYGPRWAEVSATPFRLWKRYSTEGGVSVPLIVRMPSSTGNRAPMRELAHVTDLMPTLLDVAGIGNAQAGREMSGISLRPAIEGDSQASTGRFVAGELFGGRYVTDGRWKLTAIQPPLGDGRWMLFDLQADRGETTDVAAQQPAQAERLRKAFDDYAARVGLVSLPPGTRIPAAFD